MSEARIMYIEHKGEELVGPARIGRVKASKTGKTLYYDGREFQSLKGGYKANYFDVASDERYWISGCRKDGMDALYNTEVEIDEDVRQEYWLSIRELPDQAGVRSFRAQGKYGSY